MLSTLVGLGGFERSIGFGIQLRRSLPPCTVSCNDRTDVRHVLIERAGATFDVYPASIATKYYNAQVKRCSVVLKVVEKVPKCDPLSLPPEHTYQYLI